MTDGISIREVGPEAIDDAMVIMTEAFDPDYREAWTADQCLSMLSLPGVWLMIAYAGDRPAGFALNRVIAGEAELLLLAVASTYRNRGIGRLLINQAIQTSRDRKAEALHLEVRHNNPAFQLYINCGFRIVGRRPGYYLGKDGRNHDAMTLSCLIEQI
jgi:ribosomal-protein-alanine N-acetyltransferase